MLLNFGVRKYRSTWKLNGMKRKMEDDRGGISLLHSIGKAKNYRFHDLWKNVRPGEI